MLDAIQCIVCVSVHLILTTTLTSTIINPTFHMRKLRQILSNLSKFAQLIGAELGLSELIFLTITLCERTPFHYLKIYGSSNVAKGKADLWKSSRLHEAKEIWKLI